MRFIDLYPFVLPYAQHLPNETALHHIRLAAARFFGATHAWQLELDPMTASAGKTSYSMNIEQNTDLAYLMDVTINGVADVEVINTGTAFRRSGTLRRYRASTTNKQDLIVEPAPEAGVQIIVLAALKPNTTNSTEFPDEFNEYAEHIANGALGTMLRLPGDDRDLTLAGDREKAFNAAVASVGCAVSLGHAGAKFKASGRYY